MHALVPSSLAGPQGAILSSSPRAGGALRGLCQSLPYIFSPSNFHSRGHELRVCLRRCLDSWGWDEVLILHGFHPLDLQPADLSERPCGWFHGHCLLRCPAHKIVMTVRADIYQRGPLWARHWLTFIQIIPFNPHSKLKVDSILSPFHIQENKEERALSVAVKRP